MKLRDLIASVDKSDKNSNWVDIGEISNELGINDYIQTPDSCLIKAYWISKWCCTDTWVGIIVYFIDDKPVLLTSQKGRKCDVSYYWVSVETRKQVTDYILSLKEKDDQEEDNFDYVNLEEEFGNGYQVDYGEQLLTKTLIHKATSEPVKVIETWRNHKEIDLWGKAKVQFADGSERVLSLENELEVPYCLS